MDYWGGGGGGGEGKYVSVCNVCRKLGGFEGMFLQEI